MTGISGIVAFRLADQNGTQALKRFQERPEIQREVERFKAGVRNLKSVDDFYQNERLYRFVLEGANLAGDIPFRGKVKRLLAEDHTDKEGLLYKLNDSRFRDLASVLQFESKGIDRLKTPKVQEQLINAYVKAKFEESLGTQNPGVPTARYFRDKIGSVDSEYGILGDTQLRDVVLTTLGLPKQIAVQEVESQAEAIRSRIDIEQFKNPDFVERFIQRFLVAKDQEAAKAAGGAAAGGNAYLLNVFGGSSNTFNFLV